jgi:hypothetical protein
MVIAVECATTSAAELTRRVGSLASELGLPRPCYEQVRILRADALHDAPPERGSDALLHEIAHVVGVLYEYPGPGLADWYRRYKNGSL